MGNQLKPPDFGEPGKGLCTCHPLHVAQLAECWERSNQAAAAGMIALHQETDKVPPEAYEFEQAVALQILILGAQAQLDELRRRTAQAGLPACTLPTLRAPAE